jgi:hypothetical protein
LKLVCNVNTVNGNLKSENYQKIKPRNLDEIVQYVHELGFRTNWHLPMRRGSSLAERIRKLPMFVFRNFRHEEIQLCSSTIDRLWACNNSSQGLQQQQLGPATTAVRACNNNS